MSVHKSSCPPIADIAVQIGEKCKLLGKVRSSGVLDAVGISRAVEVAGSWKSRCNYGPTVIIARRVPVRNDWVVWIKCGTAVAEHNAAVKCNQLAGVRMNF